MSIPSFFSFSALLPGLSFAAAALLSCLPADLSAQINAARVLREATGNYEVVRSGGSLRVDDGMSPFSFVPDPVRGRARIPVNSANPMATLRSRNLPGNGSSLSRGRRTQASVSRDGKRIAYAALGTCDEDDGMPLYRGTARGSFTKRGRVWSVSLLLNGTQRIDPTTLGTFSRVRLRGDR